MILLYYRCDTCKKDITKTDKTQNYIMLNDNYLCLECYQKELKT